MGLEDDIMSLSTNNHSSQQKVIKQIKDSEKIKQSKAKRRQKVIKLFPILLFRFIVEQRKKERVKVRRFVLEALEATGRN